MPKSSNPGRQRQNADAVEGERELKAADMHELDILDRGTAGSIEAETLSQDVQ